MKIVPFPVIFLVVMKNFTFAYFQHEKILVKQLKNDGGIRREKSATTTRETKAVGKQATPMTRQTSAITSDTTIVRVVDKPPLHKEQTTAMKHDRLTSVPLSTDDTAHLIQANRHSSRQAAQNVNRNNNNMRRSATSYDSQMCGGGSDRVDKGTGSGRIGDRLIGLVGEKVSGRGSNNINQVDLNGALDGSYYSNSNNTTYQLYTKMISKISNTHRQGEGQEGSGSSSSTEDKQKLSEKKQEVGTHL